MKSPFAKWLIASTVCLLSGCVEKDAAYIEARTKTLAARYKKPTNDTRDWKEQLNVQEGQLVPNISGPDCDGKRMQLRDFRGKTVLLHYWANW